MTEKIIEIIKSQLLTPVIYLLDEEILSVIGFFDGATKVNHLYETQLKIEKAIGREINLCDIRDFNEIDRLNIINHGTLIYSETPLVKNLFETAMVEDYTIAESKRRDIVQRSNKDGTVYLS